MKRITFIALLIPCFAHASSSKLESNKSFDIDNIVYYQTNFDFKSQKEDIVAYVKKNDPCITVKLTDEGTSNRYCELGNSGLNLEKDSPTIYPVKMTVFAGSVYFTVAAPWNEQKCRIHAYKKQISCSSTGN
ncbi:hypothetical protein EZI54_15030 [Marinobacter halodurans]|uniref:Uncharacterized protein n=1 Tax=Marinobacter halodurans TaxID=2528979 RepID=A0ABY1ZI41_9GAMM|nr:hypothetical protein [Marinobacter halodurans]TBW53800.1 hypothetical protein EZI54_15030 [Marinobacter halodurans]